MNFSFITYQTQKVRSQSIMVKTTLQSDASWSAIFSVIIHSIPSFFSERKFTNPKPELKLLLPNNFCESVDAHDESNNILVDYCRNLLKCEKS